MIQHLLNTTAIWLLCLLAFDLFLRKETFHSYNRFFLLLTFIIGLLLPFWEWGADSVVFSDTFREPVTSVVNVKQSIEVAASSSPQWDGQAYIGIIYLSGVLVALFMLVVDVVKVVRLYRKGIKSREGSWTIIETSVKHGPFSVFNLLFVSSKKRYTEEEWNILLAHEQEHRQRLHFIDLLLMQLSHVLFWFHPLVYLYNKRLMIVHEYEADSAIISPVAEYGRFLVEQALLSNAPVITHSFNRSPIKKRIIMLTRNSSAYTKLKLFVGLPVMVASILFFTQCASSQERKIEGNIIIYNGNKIELSEVGLDTIEVTDPVTGESQIMYEQTDPHPVNYNGEKIYRMGEVDRKPAMKGIDYKDYLQDKLIAVMGKLSDGIYNIHVRNIILDKKGKVVYYDFRGLSKRPFGESAADAQKEITDEVNKAVSKVIENAFNDLPINPGQVDGKPVITYLDDFSMKHSVLEIKDHKFK